ncbi:MAG TPA: hypothetical protein VGF38_02610 [Ktedonobacterales bacterium]|jgi:hypothetical protein
MRIFGTCRRACRIVARQQGRLRWRQLGTCRSQPRCLTDANERDGDEEDRRSSYERTEALTSRASLGGILGLVSA